MVAIQENAYIKPSALRMIYKFIEASHSSTNKTSI